MSVSNHGNEFSDTAEIDVDVIIERVSKAETLTDVLIKQMTLASGINVNIKEETPQCLSSKFLDFAITFTNVILSQFYCECKTRLRRAWLPL